MSRRFLSLRCHGLGQSQCSSTEAVARLVTLTRPTAVLLRPSPQHWCKYQSIIFAVEKNHITIHMSLVSPHATTEEHTFDRSTAKTCGTTSSLNVFGTMKVLIVDEGGFGSLCEEPLNTMLLVWKKSRSRTTQNFVLLCMHVAFERGVAGLKHQRQLQKTCT